MISQKHETQKFLKIESFEILGFEFFSYLLEWRENNLGTFLDERQLPLKERQCSVADDLERVDIILATGVRLGRVISLSLARVALGLVAGRVAGLWVVLVVVGLDCDD
jgi:hypothetical protein